MPGYDIPLVGPILNKIIGTRNDRFVKKYMQKVAAINALETQTRKLTDAQILAKVEEFRKRHDSGATSDDLMIEAFAVAREAMDRNVGIRSIFNPELNFDVSLLPSHVQDLYHQVKAVMDATPPADPVGAFLGNPTPVPSWVFVDIPNEIYEAVREIYPESKPPFRARPFDVQLIGAMVLYQGKIAEMRTGEGKTIVGPLGCYLASCERLQVHVVTVNDYLVQRDRDWTFPFFRGLGLTVGAIHPQHTQSEDTKRLMYRCDVVYGTTAEFGFDYLRDNMKPTLESQVQRKRQMAIVDEVDSTLIDEARTPLIISGPAHEGEPRYELADALARHLMAKHKPWADADESVQSIIQKIKGLEGDIRQTLDKSKIPALQQQLAAAKAELPKVEAERNQFTQYYEVKMERKSAHLTHDGVAEAQRVAGVGSFYVGENIDIPHLLEQAIRAYAVYQRDRDYVIMDVPDSMTGQTDAAIVIVDVNTGRPMIGRQWSDGLHQAVECKEKVRIKAETQTVATITIQNYFKMYKRLAGMTGTADTEAQEFHDIYKLDVVSIPTNRPMIRRDFDDLVFLRDKDKYSAIVDEIKAFSDVGRPILVGTTSVENSEHLGQLLNERYGVPHEILNAKQHDREADIVKNAGQIGQVMIATNMAGRGTDIKLGQFTREGLLEYWLKRGMAPRTLTLEASDAELRTQIYRKIAPRELGEHRRDLETMSDAELELALLRVWATKFSLLVPEDIEKASADVLRSALDASGRCLLHRLRWFKSIEDMGGLHVIGTERHESRRIDNQLRGRAGRQGDNGSSRFYVAMDDPLMKMFSGDTMNKWLARMGMKEGVAIEHPWLSKSVERAQRKVEEHNFQIRKNLLEYDEVMEHQRQTFYGLRQRALEGRDVKGLLMDMIDQSIHDAVDEYLDPEYAATCAGEFARQRMDVSVPPERLRGKEAEDLADIIRGEAKYDARQNIAITLGEFMPMEGSEVAVDFDSAGLTNWARSKFGVEIDPAELREGGAAERRRVQDLLIRASAQKIDETDLTGIEQFASAEYGAATLSQWAKRKFGIEIDAATLLAASKKPAPDEGEEDHTPAGLIKKQAREIYRKREIEQPVAFAMEMTMAISKQSRDEAAAQLVSWANKRFGINMTTDELRKSTPGKVKSQLLEASTRFVDEETVFKEVQIAQACKTDAELEAHLRKRFDVPMPDTMRYLHGRERDEAIQSRVENILRAELLYLERQILLEILGSAWRDHLYAMDQLRDTIGFRSFSQQDPRIEYKREGSHMFRSFLETVRDRVTDAVFRARLTMNQPQQPRPMQRPMAPRPAPAANASSGVGDDGMYGAPVRRSLPADAVSQTDPESGGSSAVSGLASDGMYPASGSGGSVANPLGDLSAGGDLAGSDPHSGSPQAPSGDEPRSGPTNA
ncbi:MAG: preprotein translocase subunit SecA [Planctomycetes bacterium]|nr:preprotein translocase subunit SecA [Planctomycetota bacterium]